MPVNAPPEGTLTVVPGIPPAPPPPTLALIGEKELSAEDVSRQAKLQIDRAVAVADQLRIVIDRQKLSVKLGGDKPHVRVEGWTTLARIVGLHPEIQDVTHIPGNAKATMGWGYEATCALVDALGFTQAKGTSSCYSDEHNWQGKPRYAVSSMAQTRATVRACRLALGWVMDLAGFSSTPAEEMDSPPTPPPPPGPAWTPGPVVGDPPPASAQLPNPSNPFPATHPPDIDGLMRTLAKELEAAIDGTGDHPQWLAQQIGVGKMRDTGATWQQLIDDQSERGDDVRHWAKACLWASSRETEEKGGDPDDWTPHSPRKPYHFRARIAEVYRVQWLAKQHNPEDNQDDIPF